MIRRPLPGSGRPIEGSAVHEDRTVGARLRTRVGHVALFVALAVVPVLAFNSLATATTASDGGTGPAASSRPGLTDTQRQCLSDQGVTLPTHGSTAGKPPFTREQRQQLRRATAACGVRGTRAPRLGNGLGHALTDAQRQCLADQGVSLPDRSTVGSRASLSADQRAALRQAARACGLPARGARGSDGTI